MKRFLSFFLLMTLFVGVLSACGNQTANPDNDDVDDMTQKAIKAVEYNMFVGDEAFKVGDTVTFDVNIDTHMQDVLTGAVYLTYDPEMLDISTEGINDVFSIFNMWIAKEASNGVIRLEFAQPAPGVNTAEQKRIVAVTATAKKAGTTQVKFDTAKVVANNKHVQNIVDPKYLKDITITVAEGQSTDAETQIQEENGVQDENISTETEAAEQESSTDNIQNSEQ